jgi:polyvinyl alcohol dehydrogenase (cytochrome)
MDGGVMQVQGHTLSPGDRRTVAEFLSDRPFSAQEETVPLLHCTGDALTFDYDAPPFASGWGIDSGNNRLIPGDVARLSAEDLPRLELKWAFAYPNALRARSQPTLAGGALYVGSHDGTVFALDEESGCVRWTFLATAEVRTAVVISTWEAGDRTARPSAYFGDLIGNLYAIDVVTGELLWRLRVDDHPNATITAAPTLYGDRLYVAVSSLETELAPDEAYECCKFQGSVAAFEAATGTELWRARTILEPPGVTGQNRVGTDQYGPSGSPIWNSPAIDAKRRQLYVGTGENYSSPATETSDAIFAIDLDTGSVNWVFQATANDAWNTSCDTPTNANCPVEDGPDFDFGAATILGHTSDGRDIVLAGQKSGEAFGLDPDTGRVLWRTKVGRGGVQAGVHFGMATEGDRLFVPISDWPDGREYDEPNRPGLYALDAKTGEYLWKTPADESICGDREYCAPGLSQAVTAIPGLVFAGAMDGHLRAYSSDTGEILWDVDLARSFETLNGEVARGGSMGGASGPIIHDGNVYANSGYGIYGHMHGNVLLAFAKAD